MTARAAGRKRSSRGFFIHASTARPAITPSQALRVRESRSARPPIGAITRASVPDKRGVRPRQALPGPARRDQAHGENGDALDLGGHQPGAVGEHHRDRDRDHRAAQLQGGRGDPDGPRHREEAVRGHDQQYGGDPRRGHVVAEERSRPAVHGVVAEEGILKHREGGEGEAADQHGVDEEFAAGFAPQRFGREVEKQEQHELLGALVSGDRRGSEGGGHERPDREGANRRVHGQGEAPGLAPDRPDQMEEGDQGESDLGGEHRNRGGSRGGGEQGHLRPQERCHYGLIPSVDWPV